MRLHILMLALAAVLVAPTSVLARDTAPDLATWLRPHAPAHRLALACQQGYWPCSAMRPCCPGWVCKYVTPEQARRGAADRCFPRR
jgi:hypothetical protein